MGTSEAKQGRPIFIESEGRNRLQPPLFYLLLCSNLDSYANRIPYLCPSPSTAKGYLFDWFVTNVAVTAVHLLQFEP